MNNDILYEIVQLYFEFEKFACNIFLLIKKNCVNKELEDFWEEMANDERIHMRFWNDFIPLVKAGVIPQTFSDPYTLKKDLEKVLHKVEVLKKISEKELDLNKALVIACRMEFFLLHPALEYFFLFSEELDGFIKIKITEKDYEEHIDKLHKMLITYGKNNLEIELLGEMIERVWKENRLLIKQSNTDALTGILNRRGFREIMCPLAHFSQRNDYQIGMLMLDIDYFKKINDNYGHQTGDLVLRQVATVISNSIRQSDVCGRYGGEEFVVFLTNIRKDSVLNISEKIRKGVENLKPEGITVTISIGLYIGNLVLPVKESVEKFLKEADQLLYAAKNNGRNRVVSN